MPQKFKSTAGKPKKGGKKMPYKAGGKTKMKYATGGKVRGGGAATRGLKFTRSC